MLASSSVIRDQSTRSSWFEGMMQHLNCGSAHFACTGSHLRHCKPKKKVPVEF